MRLRRLEKQKLIQALTVSYSKTLWTLHKKGFSFIQSELPQMMSVGYKSEHPIHDHLVTAFHLGEWVNASPTGVEFVSEQQLRCLTPDLFPKCLPKSARHRSDGYWILNPVSGSNPRVIGLEVERNPKSLLTYQRYFDFYDEENSVESVLWLITSNPAERRIRNILASHQVIRKEIHYLITYQDFEKNGWNAKAVNIHQAAKTPYQILIKNQFKTDLNLIQNQNFKALLDLRKSPLESNTSES
jgi:hypothetical protein